MAPAKHLLQTFEDLKLLLVLCWEAGIVFSAIILSPFIIFNFFIHGYEFPRYTVYILYALIIIHIASRFLSRNRWLESRAIFRSGDADIALFYYDDPCIDFLIGLCLCVYTWSLILKYLLNYSFPEIYNIISGGFLFLVLLLLLSFVTARVSRVLAVSIVIILTMIFLRDPIGVTSRLGILLEGIYGAPLFWSVKMIVSGSRLGEILSCLRY